MEYSKPKQYQEIVAEELQAPKGTVLVSDSDPANDDWELLPVGPGVYGQVLTSNGPGTLPTFQPVPTPAPAPTPEKDTGWRSLCQWNAQFQIFSGGIEGYPEWTPVPWGGDNRGAMHRPGGIWYRRIGSQGYLKIDGLSTSVSSPSAAIGHLPAGFRPATVQSKAMWTGDAPCGVSANYYTASIRIDKAGRIGNGGFQMGTLSQTQITDILGPYLIDEPFPADPSEFEYGTQE